MILNYLGIDITSTRNLTAKETRQVTNAAEVTGYFGETIWNKNMHGIMSKLNLNKSQLRPEQL